MEERIFMKLIGYVQLYFKITGKKDIYYAKFDSDFGKPVTKKVVNLMRNRLKEAYAQYDGILSVDICTKEEYEREVIKQDATSVSWGDSQN